MGRAHSFRVAARHFADGMAAWCDRSGLADWLSAVPAVANADHQIQHPLTLQPWMPVKTAVSHSQPPSASVHSHLGSP